MTGDKNDFNVINRVALLRKVGAFRNSVNLARKEAKILQKSKPNGC